MTIIVSAFQSVSETDGIRTLVLLGMTINTAFGEIRNPLFIESPRTAQNTRNGHFGDCGLTFSAKSVVVRPHFQSMNGVTNVHGQVDGSDFLITLEIIEADG